eukprot:Opistho-1_new@84545
MAEGGANGAHAMPEALKEDISSFKMDGYAAKFFSVHKRGLFRRKVPMKSMLQWAKEAIPAPILVMPPNPKHKNVPKDAVKNFKIVQSFMGDRALPKDLSTPAQLALSVLEKGLLYPEIRDEIFVQLIKQTTNNKRIDSNCQGWILISLCVTMFPPSRNLESYLRNYIQQHYSDADFKVVTLAKYAMKKLSKVCETGPRIRVPTLPEVERAMVAPFNPSVFNVTLDDIMQLQQDFDPEFPLPKVMTVLADAVLRLGGEKAEGIFRVPGDMDAVAALKLQIEKGDYDIKADDPHVPGSLLKLWLRELEEPLIPADIYPKCIKQGGGEADLSVLDALPAINREVIEYMIKFLRQIGRPENHAVTKMTYDNLAMVFAPSFLRCPSEDPQTIFENTRHEQDFARAMLERLNCS